MTQDVALDFVVVLLALWCMTEKAQTHQELDSVEVALNAVQRMIARIMGN